MKRLIRKISQAVQVILLAPIKLPAKAMTVLRYLAVGLGIMEQVMQDENKEQHVNGKEEGDENVE